MKVAVTQGLNSKRHKVMIEMARDGVPANDIAEHLEVDLGYVKKQTKGVKLRVRPGKNDTIEALTDRQLAVGDGYDLKDLRAYLRDYYGVEIASSTSRDSVLRAFFEARDAEQEG